MTKTVVIYHGNCPDGFTAAWAAYKHFGDAATYYPAKHGELPPFEMCRGAEVYVVDFSYPLPLMEQLIEEANWVTILDHHESAFRNLSPLIEEHRMGGTIDMDRCGCVITWAYFHQKPFPPLLPYIQDRDLHQWNLPSSFEVNEFILIHEYRFEVWDDLMYRNDFGIMARIGDYLLTKRDRDLTITLEVGTRMIQIKDWEIPVVNVPHTMVSDAALMLLDIHPHVPFAGAFTVEQSKVRFSLRSRNYENFNVREVAEWFGGGGHPHAAGFTTGSQELCEMLCPV